MSDMQRYPFALAANGTMMLPAVGSRFLILSATGALTVSLDVGGRMQNIVAGMGYRGRPFNLLTITDLTGAPNSGFILVSDDDFVDNTAVISGAITIGNWPAVQPVSVSTNKVAQVASMVPTTPALTAASTQMLAANAARQFLLVQNLDVAADAYLSLDGAVATVARGIKVPANGGMLMLDVVVPTCEIRWIGNAAAAAGAVRVVEG
jgi:hypothetical protein